MTPEELFEAAPELEANAVRPVTDGWPAARGEWEYTLTVDLRDGEGRRVVLAPGRAG